MVLEVIEGSIWVRWTSTSPSDTQRILGLHSKCSQRKLQLHPFFRKFKLSPDDFDPAFNYHYKDKHWREWRGDWFYYLPVFCKKYGLKVKNLYADNRWIEDQNQGWAVGFHGLASPTSQVQGSLIHLPRTILSRNKILATTEVDEAEKAVNKESEAIGTGVAFSPHLYAALSYAQTVKVQDRQYRLILQCRLPPEGIKVCQKNEAKWVMNHPGDIRPYGVILVKEEDYERVSNSRYRFQPFSWRDQVEARHEGRQSTKY